MRKLCMGLMVFLVLLIYGQADASIVEIYAIDDLMLDVYGFGADISAPTDAITSDFTLSIGSGIPSPSLTSLWVTWVASIPTLGVQSLDFLDPGAALGNGLILSIQSPFDFELSNFILTDNAGTAYSKDLFDIITGTNNGNLTYTISNPVPIPSALLLLGSGLVGMIGFRRKIKK